MPAVSADTLSLPRISPVSPTAVDRSVRSITTGPTGFEGEGFPVRRAFAGATYADIDPFIMMDQMGEVEYAAGEPKGTPWHPHRGFETFTYLIDGQFLHQASHGGGGTILEGGTQYMTAGDGILHIETPPAALVESGGLFHGIQLWINLPRTDKLVDPFFTMFWHDAIPRHVAVDGAGRLTEVTVVAGALGDAAPLAPPPNSWAGTKRPATSADRRRAGASVGRSAACTAWMMRIGMRAMNTPEMKPANWSLLLPDSRMMAPSGAA